MTTQRTAHRGALATLAMLLAAALRVDAACSIDQAMNRADPPNIILIVADDLGWQDLPFFSPPIHWPGNNPKDANLPLTARDAYVTLRPDRNRMAARLLAETPCESAVSCGPCTPAHPLGTFVRTTSPTPYPVIPDDATGTPTGHTYVPDACSATPASQILSHFGGFRRLRDQGMLFPRFYASSALCEPSRVGMMTGRGGPRTSKIGNGGALAGHEVTIAEYLRQGCTPCTTSPCPVACFSGQRDAQGYCTMGGSRAPCFRTGLIGKWHMGLPRSNLSGPGAQGFVEAVTHAGQGASYFPAGAQLSCSRDRLYLGGDSSHTALECNGTEPAADCCSRGSYAFEGSSNPNDRACNTAGPPACTYNIRGYTQLALNFIERHRAERFFLVLTHNAVHAGQRAPKWVKAHYEMASAPQQAYWAQIEDLDASVGQILTRLNDLNLASRTLVFFTSDNGANYGGSSSAEGPRGDPRLRGGKKTMYDGGIRMGLFARACGANASRRTDAVISGVDLLPTIAEAVGFPVTLVGNDLRTCDDGSDCLRGTCNGVGCKHHWIDGASFHYLLLTDPDAQAPPRNFVYAKIQKNGIAVAGRTLQPTAGGAWPPGTGGGGVCGFAGEDPYFRPVRYGSCRRCTTDGDCTGAPGCQRVSDGTTGCTTNCCPVCLPSAWKLITAQNPTVPGPQEIPAIGDRLYDVSTNPEERDELRCESARQEIWRDLKTRAASWNTCTGTPGGCG